MTSQRKAKKQLAALLRRQPDLTEEQARANLAEIRGLGVRQGHTRGRSYLGAALLSQTGASGSTVADTVRYGSDRGGAG